jgi:hypothetical protein
MDVLCPAVVGVLKCFPPRELDILADKQQMTSKLYSSCFAFALLDCGSLLWLTVFLPTSDFLTRV